MNVNLMKQLCSLDQQKLKAIVHKFLTKKYDNVICTEEYLFAEGEVPICLVAHLDTVFKQPPTDIFYDQEKKVMWSPQGLGTDDRAGVYAIIELLSFGYKPSVIFTTDEEIGGVGATELVTRYPECPFNNIKAIIELDRQGEKDCVFYHCDNPDFEEYIYQFDFTPALGSFSDISIIAPQWGIAAVNLSVGYVDEHSYSERLYEQFLDATIEKVKNILDKADTMLNYEYIPMLPAFGNNCIICQKMLNVNNFKSVTVQGMSYNVCKDCYNEYYRVENQRKTRKRK